MANRTNLSDVFRAPRSPEAPPGTLRSFAPYKLGVPAIMPMWISNTDGENGSVKSLAQNDYRASVTIQNLSTSAILYFTWGQSATTISGLALGPGKGLILDVICPQASLYLFMDSAVRQLAQIMEISYA